MSKKVALYLRVSTIEQTLDNQRQHLEEVAARSGWTITHIFEEHVSGAAPRAQRPQFDELSRAAARREFDLIAAWSVDRLGRSLQDLVQFLNDIRQYRIDLYLHQQALDTSTPSGRLLYQLLGVFAEFERAMIRERTLAGLQRARNQGKRLGRPPIPPIVRRQVIETLQSPTCPSLQKVANKHKISKAAVVKIKQTL